MKVEERFEDQPIMEIPLTPGEQAVFGKIEQDEAIHNELGSSLGAFRDSIIEYRNNFLDELCKKYGIKKRNLMRYDPIGKRLVSVFHPTASSHKIVDRPEPFRTVAFNLVNSAIKDLRDILKSYV